MKREIIVVLVILVLFIPLSAFSAESIKIGVLGTLTGPQGYLGKYVYRAAEAVADNVNKEGGIKGRHLELLTYNDEGKEENTVLGFQKFVKQSQVTAIVGPTWAPTSYAVAKLNKKGPVSVSTSAGFIPEGDSYMFATGGVHTGEILKLLFTKWCKEKGYARIGLIAGLYASGQEWVNFAEKYVKEYPGCTLTVERFKLTDVDMVSQLVRLKSQNPQLLIVSAVGKSAVMIAKNFNQLEFNIPILYSHSNASISFLELLGNDRPKSEILFPVFAIHIWRDLPDSHPQKAICREISELYKNLHKQEMEDPYFAGQGADALMLITSALKAVGTDPKKTKEYIETTSMVGTTAFYRYSKENHLGSDMSSVFIGTAMGNRFKLIP